MSTTVFLARFVLIAVLISCFILSVTMVCEIVEITRISIRRHKRKKKMRKALKQLKEDQKRMQEIMKGKDNDGGISN